LVAPLFDLFLRLVATRLGNFVLPAGLRVRRLSSLSIAAYLSRVMQLETLFLVRDESLIGTQHQSVQSAFI
jgi:hypothetical protein